MRSSYRSVSPSRPVQATRASRRDQLTMTLTSVDHGGDDEQPATSSLPMPLSIADLGEQRPGLLGERLDHHEQRRPPPCAGLRVARKRRSVNGAGFVASDLVELDVARRVLGLGREERLDPVGQLRRARRRRAGPAAALDGVTAASAPPPRSRPDAPAPGHQSRSRVAASSIERRRPSAARRVAALGRRALLGAGQDLGVAGLGGHELGVRARRPRRARPRAARPGRRG